MNYYIIAGENSGDLHGSNLMKEIKQLDSDAKFRFCGGNLMLQENSNICLHVKDMSFMGFVEVLLNIRTITRNMTVVKKDITDFSPDALVLIDYPGFNLRMAEFAKQLSIPVYYYISPKVWAWKASRIKKIKAFVHRLYVILPFEKSFFSNHGYDAEYVGNPILDAIDDFKTKAEQQIKPHQPDKKIIALLPGSRKMEVEKLLPAMLEAVKNKKDYQVIIAGVSSLPKELYAKYNEANYRIVFDITYQLLTQAHAALVTSGTATLETALFHVPQVVCYKANSLTIWIAKKLVKIKFISLVNLIMDKEVVKELIQNDLKNGQLERELNKLLDGEFRRKMLDDYQLLQEKMGPSGASRRVAEKIVSDVKI